MVIDMMLHAKTKAQDIPKDRITTGGGPLAEKQLTKVSEFFATLTRAGEKSLMSGSGLDVGAGLLTTAQVSVEDALAWSQHISLQLHTDLPHVKGLFSRTHMHTCSLGTSGLQL